MLQILQTRLQQYVNSEIPDVYVGFEKTEEPELKLPLDQRKRKRIPEKHLLLLHCTKAFDCVDYNRLSELWKVVKDRESWHASVPGVTETGTLASDWTITTWVWKSVHILRENRSNTTSNCVYPWKIFSPMLLIYTVLCFINPLFFFFFTIPLNSFSVTGFSQVTGWN